MSSKLRMGVIGLGLIGRLHARIVYENPSADLVAVMDINPQTAESVAKDFVCKAYTDFKVMCDQEDLDAVCICTPDEYHVENAAYAASKGIHLLVEKPIAKTEKEAAEILTAVQKYGVRMMIAHVLHFDPRYAQMRAAATSGSLGDVIHMFFRRTNPRSNGRRLGGKVSIFHFIGIHDFEMMCFCAGSKPIKAYCQRVTKVNADIGCEDTTMSMITFANGAVGTIELSWALPENSMLGINTYAEIVGVKGAAYVDIMNQGLSLIDDKNVFFPDTLHWPEYNGKIQGDLKEEIDHFIQATLNKTPYLVDTQNAVLAVKVIEACFKSIEIGEAVPIL